MSRLTRTWEHLKTGFQAEAASAARLQALARRAEQEGRPRLAAALAALAREKSDLAARLLDGVARAQDWLQELETLAAEERYEVDVLYAKMLADVEGDPRKLLEVVRNEHQEHLARLEAWIGQLLASRDDLPAT